MTLATSMSDNLSVKVLRSVADLEAIRQVWESWPPKRTLTSHLI
jgi:hypothetical protein